MIFKKYIILLSLFLIFTSNIQISKSDENDSFDKRVFDLVSQMTLKEKVSQLLADSNLPIPRLNIPFYNWHNEALHGIVIYGATSFPQSIALAATFDTDLMLEVATAISDEGRAFYNRGTKGLNYWSPVLNLCRDPRWGRNPETYGEDPYLLSRMAVAYIKGIQGDDKKYLKAIASPKHYGVHSGPEAKRFKFDAVTSERDFWETYMPGWKVAIIEGKAHSIMTAYSAYKGIPTSASEYLIDDILRRRWGFSGYVTCDCGALSGVVWAYWYGNSEMEAAALGLKAGLDLECGFFFNAYLPQAYEKGLVTMTEIDSAVTRTLKARFLLGLFDNPDSVKYNMIPDSVIEGEANRQLAVKAVEKTIVLLKNENKLLPLSKNIKSLYVMGPNAHALWEVLGGYAGRPSKWFTILDKIKENVSPDTKVDYDRVCEINGSVTELVSSKYLKSPEGKIGLKGEYFTNKELKGSPALIRIDTVIDFNWWRTSPITGSDKGEDFSVRWTGTFTPEVSAVYTFSTISGDGARLFINGKKIIDSWWEHPPSPIIGFDTLEAGVEYPIVLEYFFTQSYSKMRFEFGSELTAQSTIDKYIEKAKNSEAVVFVGGISAAFEDENKDRKHIDLPEGQRRMLKLLKANNIPVVLVLLGGSCFTINWENDNIDAILMAWYGGNEMGQGLYNVLFGDYNPGAKLPITFYKSENDLPHFDDYFMEGRTYRYFRKEPLYPFGFGLSYTTFEYNNMSMPITDVDICTQDTIPVNFTVTNTGDREGDEIVQLYTVMLDSKEPQPIKQLKGFKRVNLKAGEKKSETILLNLNELYYYDTSAQKTIVEPGRYEIQIASSSADVKYSKILNLQNCNDTNIQNYDDEIVKFYPNPANNIINLTLKSVPLSKLNITIFSLDGKDVFSSTFNNINSKTISINCSELGTGLFFAKIEDGALTYYKKFIINR